MGKISIVKLSDAPTSATAGEGREAIGSVDTRSLLAGESDPIHVDYHVMKAGSTLRWAEPAVDQCAYVLKGAVDVGGKLLDRGGCLIVEHGGTASVRTDHGAELIVFHHRHSDMKEGGKAHFIRHDDVPRCDHLRGYEEVGMALLADSTCPTCRLWLQENVFHEEGSGVSLHSHSEDEVIVVLGGELVLGNRRYGATTAIAIPKDTRYQFKSGSGGLTFINFRAMSPTATGYEPGGVQRFTDEGDFLRERIGRSPVHIGV